ncbi:MAG: polysaccharide biosynthesis C-terminal domain-containing protein, partial [Bacteroidota bacterium]
HNTISSAVGLVFTILLGLLLIPRYGIAGAGISATISYSMLTLYQFIVFSRMTKITPRDFLLTKAEIRLFSVEIRKMASRKR